MDEKIKVTLARPITVKGLGEVREVELRLRATVGDYLYAEKAGGKSDTIAFDVALFSRQAGLLPEDFEALDIEDYQKITKALGEAKKAKAGSTPPTT